MLIARAEVTRADGLGATEINGVKIDAIDVYDSLGYLGCGREEHSGENAPARPTDLLDELADNDAAHLLVAVP